MSGPPEDRPTEPRRPRVSPEREAVETHEDGPGWAAQLDDQLRSLKSMVALIGVLALAALGLALYDLLRDDGGGDQRGASEERVAQLDDRLERLENRAGDASDESDVAQLEKDLQDKADQSDVQQLGEEVEALRGSVEELASGSESTAEQITELSQRVDELEAEVEQLQAESQQQP